MSESRSGAVLGTAASFALGLAIAWAIGQGGQILGGLSLSVWCALLAFGLNWLAFVPSFLAKTEHYFDLVGGMTFLFLLILSFGLSSQVTFKAGLVGTMTAIWALRLSTFLFLRVCRRGKDGRFDEIKADFVRFLLAWTLQGLWVSVTMACVLALVTAPQSGKLGLQELVGGVLWTAGFAIEVAADQQKSKFRGDPENRDRFIQSGLWSWSRHPNYFGEIVLWTGIALLVFPELESWRYLALVSPVFVYCLLRFGTGVPLLEAHAEKKWGQEADYQAYKRRTSILLLTPPKSPKD